ncbi:MAG: hypothetical protein ACK55I_41930, partial [bacterium]
IPPIQMRLAEAVADFGVRSGNVVLLAGVIFQIIQFLAIDEAVTLVADRGVQEREFFLGSSRGPARDMRRHAAVGPILGQFAGAKDWQERAAVGFGEFGKIE